MSTYDVALADGQGYFAHRVAELCGEHNLSFFLIEPVWARDFLEKLLKGDVSCGMLIDMASDPYDRSDIYYRIAREAKASGAHVVDDPDASPIAAHKGKFHRVLAEHGVATPDTVLLRREDLPHFRVDDALRHRIGSPFVAKPGWGSGRQGVVLDAATEADVLRSAAASPRSDVTLLQRRIVPRVIDGRPAWFRIYYACGEIIPCWWHPETGDYRMVSPLERRMHGLVAAEGMVHKIGALSGMEFFSTEIALTAEQGFLAIDYLNDECDMHPKSYHASGPPDEVVRRIAQVMVQRAIGVVHKHPFAEELNDRDRFWQEQRLLRLHRESLPAQAIVA